MLIASENIDILNNISIDILKKINDLILYKISERILNNIVFKNMSIILSNNDIQKYNIFNYELDNENIVIPILNITFNNLIQYLEQYNDNYTLINIYNTLLLNTYFNNNNEKYVNLLINNIELIHINFSNINDYFKKRLFKQFLNPDYLNNLSNNYNYVDITINNYINTDYDIEFNSNDIFKIFLLLNKKQRFLLYCYLLIDSKYCNIVINNYDLLNMMYDTILQFGPLFRYLLSYTWIKLYYDECYKSKDKNYVFNINTASILPVFPFNYKYPKLNPYTPLLISDDLLNANYNLLGDFNNINLNMICDIIKFKENFNIFCTCNINNNLFEGYNFTNNNCYIVGSSLMACIQLHPMGLNILNNNINEYINEYYNESDIDIVFLESNILLYIDKVELMLNEIDNNIKKYNNVLNSKLNKRIKQSLYLVISENYIKTYINNNNIDYIIKNINSSDIINLFIPLYDKLKDKIMKEYNINKKKKYLNIFNISNIKYIIKIDNNMKDPILNISFKYNITSPFLPHSLEIFSHTNDNIINIVSDFHLPCCRLYYNNDTVHLLPSCITAITTRMCLDYKYFYSNKLPMQIILNKKMKGFGTWLNFNEKQKIKQYILHNSYYKLLLNIDQYNINSKIFSPISLQSRILTPQILNNKNNNRYNTSNLQNKYIYNNNSISNIICLKFNSINLDKIDYDMFICIDKYGNIVPVKKWIIDTTWNYYDSFY